MKTPTYRAPYSRTRVLGKLEAPLSITETLSGAPSGNGLVGTYANPAMGEYSVMSDVVTPGFAIKRSRGDLVFNPMSSVTRSVSSSGGGFVVRQLTPSTWANAVYTGSGNWFAQLVSRCPITMIEPTTNFELMPKLDLSTERDAVARAIAVASTKAQTVPSDASLLVALAEYRQTLALVPDLLSGWKKLFARINAREASFSRKRTASRPQDAVRNLRDLQDELWNTWLALRFGARPLVTDTMGVLKAIQRARNNADAIRQTQRGSSDVKSNTVTTAVVSYGVGNYPLMGQHSFSASVRGTCLWEAKISAMDDLGVNVAHVPEALVDLTSFSFLLNWVINLNDIALALGSAVQPGWTKVGGCYVVRRESSSVYTLNGPVVLRNSNYAINRAIEGHLVTTTRSVERSAGLPTPSLVLRPMPFEWARDARLLDAIALLRQHTRGKGVQLLAQIMRKA